MSWPGSVVACVAVLPLLLGATACGSDDAPEPDAAEETSTSPTPSATEDPSVPADAPDCSGLWHEGGDLPRGYDGCVDPAGSFVPRDALSCSSGQFLVQYDDTYYAVVGGTIHESSTSLTDDRDYRAAVRSCRA